MNTTKKIYADILRECRYFFARFTFKKLMETEDYLIVENQFCRLKFCIHEQPGYEIFYQAKGVDYDFSLPDIYQFLVSADKLKVFDTMFYKNLCGQPEVLFTIKFHLDFLAIHLSHILVSDKSWSGQMIAALEYDKHPEQASHHNHY